MSGAGNRKELSKSFDDGENNGLKKIHVQISKCADKNVIDNAPRISSAHLHIYTFALLLCLFQDGVDLNYKSDQYDNRR